MDDHKKENIKTKYPDFLCYYFRDTPAFKSILEMGLSNAKQFLKQNDCKWRSEESYLPYRLELEGWIKKQFINKGGKPKLEYPVYMSLGKELMIEKDTHNKRKLIIPLNIFSKNDLSFTYLDSMHTKEGKQPFIFMLDEIEEMIDTHRSGYTEAQIWNMEPLEKIKDEYFSTGRLDFINS